MKLQFVHQQFQTDAVNAVADLFLGQEKCESTFSIPDSEPGLLQTESGIANGLNLDHGKLLPNLHEIQKRNLLPLSEDVEPRQFTIEMETGTGKTYVYIKTIFELNRRYGLTKFAIVVPSLAIREGVYKTFEITRSHFANLYDNVPCRYFIYNSARLSDVRQFATSSNIEIMIINIDAFRKAENVINQPQDKLNGETAMKFIQDTRPIIIIDEPQSVDNTPKAKEAISSLNPLFVLRYSATHREKMNLVYRLTPVDAYQMGLVKQIVVSSNMASTGFNKPYVRLNSVSSDNGFRAEIEIHATGKDGKTKPKKLKIKPGDDLYVLSGNREIYEGYVIEGIDCTEDFECIEFANTERIKLGGSIGDIDEQIIKEEQIRRTIEAHLDKELRLLGQGIKVLSLFFIDEVAKYRGPEGEKGIYAEMFERSYESLLNLPQYTPLKQRFDTDIAKVHDGYFSQDKKGRLKNTKGDTADDTDTYNTIMRDKEWLLSFECPLRFIFSHSALKEGWDNPNVFQVCTLIDQKSTFTCRQKVGRGLRLCVNQVGERIEDRNINILHVMANESFAEFADTLQKEIEAETGVRFGIIDVGLFADVSIPQTVVELKTVTASEATLLAEHVRNDLPLPPELEFIREQAKAVIEAKGTEVDLTEITFKVEKTKQRQLSYDEAKALVTHFEDKGYITKTGRIKDTMKADLERGVLDVPKRYEAACERFKAIILGADKRVQLRDASKEITVKLKKQVLLSPEFLALWNKIKQKTTYRVQFDERELVKNGAKALQAMPAIPKPRLVSQTAEISIEKSGVGYAEKGIKTKDLADIEVNFPDLLTVVAEQVRIKPETLFEILLESGRFPEFKNNPQLFIENCIECLQKVCFKLNIDGIRYQKLAGEEYYIQEIFESSELLANLEKNAVPVEHSVYDHIIYDSTTVEKPFALALDQDPEVKMFFKLPTRFTIDTPIGKYNPDWAILLERDGHQKLYFILETKGNTDLFELRTSEQLKIHCGKQHFKALDDQIELQTATKWNDFKVNI